MDYSTIFFLGIAEYVRRSSVRCRLYSLTTMPSLEIFQKHIRREYLWHSEDGADSQFLLRLYLFLIIYIPCISSFTCGSKRWNIYRTLLQIYITPIRYSIIFKKKTDVSTRREWKKKKKKKERVDIIRVKSDALFYSNMLWNKMLKRFNGDKFFFTGARTYSARTHFIPLTSTSVWQVPNARW